MPNVSSSGFQDQSLHLKNVEVEKLLGFVASERRGRRGRSRMDLDILCVPQCCKREDQPSLKESQ